MLANLVLHKAYHTDVSDRVDLPKSVEEVCQKCAENYRGIPRGGIE